MIKNTTNKMKYYIITGISSGIGEALVKILLKQNNTKVIGISKKNIFSNEKYYHIFSDFSITEFIENIQFPEIEENDEVFLINNAGVISEIKRIGNVETKSIINDFNVNAIAPLLLINKFIKKYQNINSKKTILNISSGAGRHTIDAWTTYCASKSAMDMFSENIYVEQQFYPEEMRFSIYSVAPGVVDTPMQEKIRNSDENNFSEKEKFVLLKKNNQLSNPNDIAEKLIFCLDKGLFKKVKIDLREN
jgi:benzil reductase ((S)-benzoin forming)